MNPLKVNRNNIKQLTDLPNVGKETAKDLFLLGIKEPNDLIGCEPFAMYDKLCDITAVRHDPCVIDVFISITRFMQGDEPKSWWEYTSERKRQVNSGR